ncbi:sn-glycerol-3-phosphate ABC transporter ATP-binding protein UgpC [Arsenicitalea aurantiaca]|uniref:sn-glycerol-3-phosphate ABC transporter ATP-binding protein UgpC n=1 Tax=Arsenicitalea aurantiaca TaxID=1783274 RepID=A0A433XL44_9HYPH|nr:sn-glycerol-3-phosphate ABC transporter ATP-binding protein UgpC [Arsenicitalea aurantiaca]RUT34792.1 sn-glycerol-3-phosphate ABC transporter ATP-binding protein UgpC [Arsenicitalea aurantiaca]
MASVTISDMRKSFGKHEVIHGVDIKIADGSFVALVGPSGCGKSTLLRMIAGLEEISAGELRIGERVVNELPSKDRDIAMVFQSYALYPHLTVAENMGFSLSLKKASKAETEERVGYAARTLGLEALLDRKPKQLSGGQRQRVAMGRAIVRDPQVFLFDEPLSNLDAKLRVQMRGEIKALHRRLATTTIYVTHDQVEAMTMADEIVVLRDGRVEQAGQPMDLYDAPANIFVAGFIGSPAMNFFAATIESVDTLRLEDGTAIPFSGGEGLAKDQRVSVGIRPEHLMLAPGGAPSKITLVEPTGPETLLTLEVGHAAVTMVSRERRRFTEGEIITIAPEPDRLHLFDPETGMRLPQRQ